MTVPNPKDYDFIWLVKNFPYFFTSIVIEKGYMDYDFIITNKQTEWKMYLNKKERARLSSIGLEFLQNQLPSFETKTKGLIQEADLKFDKTMQENLSALSNSDIRNRFLELINFNQQLFESYFFTEYFFYDEVQNKIENRLPEHDKLPEKVLKMQKLKLRFREIINKTIFSGNVFENYFEEIKKRTGISDVHNFHYKEIAGTLSGTNPKREDMKHYVLGKFNEWKPITGDGALRIIKQFEKIHFPQKNLQELRGQVANPGLYKGYVKLIPLDFGADIEKEIAQMNRGDVLVTGTTGPEMMLACMKAGAIVTEEGGICSHAAIISRELKIPCIIATKIATHVLKDGDFVEVDAYNGVVKILKKDKTY